MPTTIDRSDAGALLARAEALLASGRRAILGIVGPPGAGKSTLASELVDALGGRAVLLPMDGFHLAGCELERLGRTARKGSLDTFDGFGFLALLHRVAAAEEKVVYAPLFSRDLDEPIAGAIAVPSATPLVVVEGNYLLVEAPPWRDVRGLLAECWYVEPTDDIRVSRLIARHVRFGRDPDAARRHALGSDQANAWLIASTRDDADVIVAG